jgi:hypothetical protein
MLKTKLYNINAVIAIIIVVIVIIIIPAQHGGCV